MFIAQVWGLRSRDVNVVMHKLFPQRFHAIVGDINKYKKTAERYHYVMKENSSQARQKEELISLQYCALEGHGYSLFSEV